MGLITAGGAVTINHTRARTWTAAQLALGAGILVGCEEPFDGIEWAHVSLANAVPTGHRRASVDYWDGSAWVEISSVIDSTVSVLENSGDYYVHSLTADGRLSWHRSHAAGWATRTEDGRALYFVRIRLTDGQGTNLAAQLDLTLAAPGAHCFALEPVKSILPFRAKSGLEVIVLASDRDITRSGESGANICVLKGPRAAECPILVDDRGACVFGEVAYPDISRAIPGEAWPGGTWTTVTASVGNEGVAGALIKHNQDYEWRERQFRGGVKVSTLGGQALSFVVSTWGGSFTVTGANANFTSIRDNAWEGFRLRCTADGSGSGTPIGEEVEIWGVRSGVLYYGPRFSIDPDSQNTFEVLAPHGLVHFRRSSRQYEVADLTGANAPHRLLLTAADYTSALDTTDDDRHGHFVVGRRVRDVIPGGELWTALFDLTTRKLLLQNDRSGLLEYDGVRLSRHLAEDSEDSARVRQWVGALPDQARDLLSPAALAGSKLRKKPPSGRFVTDYRGRTVVAIPPFRIAWSAPSPDNDIWPLVYETQIRDDQNDEITGIFEHGGALCVTTTTSIHTSGAPDDSGMFRLAPTTQGIGFLAHRSITRINRNLTVGVTADGVYLFDGASMKPILDDWRRVLPEGVNTSRLKESVGAASIHEGRLFFGVPSAGSCVLDKILVYDLEDATWWVWSAPWGGIASMARDYDKNGRERVLFGTVDGHLAVLCEGETDDGDAVTGTVRAAPIMPVGSATTSPQSVMVTAYETGTKSLTVKAFMNEHDAGQTISRAMVPTYDETGLYSAAGNDLYGTAEYGRKLVTEKFTLRHSERCESFEVELSGSSQWELRNIEDEISATKARRSR
ncbi:MAG: hypothetical protein ACRBI6_04495 [Acidimicrobiales bacterium]